MSCGKEQARKYQTSSSRHASSSSPHQKLLPPVSNLSKALGKELPTKLIFLTTIRISCELIVCNLSVFNLATLRIEREKIDIPIMSFLPSNNCLI